MAVFDLVEKALDIRAFYHKIIAGNIANAETPNYKEKDIDFSKELEKRVGVAGDIEVKERADYDGIPGLDGNTVDVERQVVKMSENSMLYNALVQVVVKKFSLMRYAINEGKR
jgi:flagellar basal-body rod protein FlgB